MAYTRIRLVDTVIAAIGAPCAFRELAAHGRPLAAVGRWRHAGGRVDLTGADAVQLIFSVSGGQLVELRRGDHHVRSLMREGNTAVTSPAHPAVVTVTGEADVVQILIARETMRAAAAKSAPARRKGEHQGGLNALGAQALVALDLGGGGLDDIVRAIAEVLTRPIPKSAVARGGLSAPARRRVRDLVDTRINAARCDPPSLAELADAAHLSTCHFARAFRASEAQTPHAYVARHRFDRALALLLRADDQVGTVADRSGFASPAHFIAAFRKHMGVTPGAVRATARRR